MKIQVFSIEGRPQEIVRVRRLVQTLNAQALGLRGSPAGDQASATRSRQQGQPAGNLAGGPSTQGGGQRQNLEGQ